MRQITITDGVDTVVLMKDLEFTIQPTMVGTRSTMASGRTVMDIVGEKVMLEIPTGWLSLSDLAKLKMMIRKNHLLTISYPDVEGDKVEQFIVDHPVYRAFRYDENGVDLWYGVTITAEQYGVDTISG